MAVMFDRIVSMGGWVHAIDERDIGTELPLRTEDFFMEVASCCHYYSRICVEHHPASNPRESSEYGN
jgi:hypothetical protein